MKHLLDSFVPITLDEMSGIRLMNRTDTKFVTTRDKLATLLARAADDYRVQVVDGERVSPYYTVYFDTPDQHMYRIHEAGHARRQKLRIRSYVNSGLNFLEVKTKDNHGRTSKTRTTIDGFDPLHPDHAIRFGGSADADAHALFLARHLSYAPQELSEQLENHFNRITLVNNDKTERLTIDIDLCFDSLLTGKRASLGQIAIIELKRDSLQPSPVLGLLRDLRIKPVGFSKYVIGAALTDERLSRNRLKPRLRLIHHLNSL